MPLHLPEQIESERLIIRVARPEDGKVYNEAVIESLEELSPWLGWVTPPPTIEDSEESCRKALGRFYLNEDLQVFFFSKECGSLVGGSGLHNVDWDLGHFEVGYWGRTSFGGRGLMTEGVKALAHHALKVLGASRVFLTADECNTASCRLAERAGFECEGTIRNDARNLEGTLRNTRVYSIVPASERDQD